MLSLAPVLKDEGKGREGKFLVVWGVGREGGVEQDEALLSFTERQPLSWKGYR